MFVYFIGLLAGICTTITLIPQVIKVKATKNTDGISLLMYIIFSLSIILWLSYGILTLSVVIILPNLVALPLSAYVMYYVVKNNRNKNSKISTILS